MKSWVGRSILVIGMLHTLVGVVEAAFWFLFTGFALLIIGGLVVWIERNNMYTPAFLSWSFLSIAAVGAFMMPVSGFWLLFIPTIGLFRRPRQSGG